MAKKYLAFKDDLTKVLNQSIVMKPSSSFTILSDLPLGSSIYIPETVDNTTNNVEYILVEVYDGVATVMRKDLAASAAYWSSQIAYVSRFLEQQFPSRFSQTIKENFCLKTIPGYGSQVTYFVPSRKGMFNTGSKGYTYWAPYLDSLVATYNGTAQAYWLSDINGLEYYDYVTATGTQSSTSRGSWLYVRPCIALYADAKVNATTKILMNYNKTYTDTLEEVQDGDYFYKIKDIDGRDSSNISYDNTTSGMTATTVKGAIDEIVDTIGDVETALANLIGGNS